jgi:hypothetical protein
VGRRGMRRPVAAGAGLPSGGPKRRAAPGRSGGGGAAVAPAAPFPAVPGRRAVGPCRVGAPGKPHRVGGGGKDTILVTRHPSTPPAASPPRDRGADAWANRPDPVMGFPW